MRWIVYLVVLANAALLYWHVEERERRATVKPKVTRNAAVTQLVLLDEIDRDELRPRYAEPEPTGTAEPGQPDVVETPASQPVLPIVKLTCYSVGPLTGQADREAVSAWLAALGAEAVLREDELRELARYWVHVPPLPTRAEAQQFVQRLSREGVSDMHVIRRGNMANAVSLGVYSRKAHLDRRVANLEKLGVQPKVTERYRTRRASWFDVVLPADTPLDEERLAGQFSQVESRQRPCGNPGSAT
ncbi:MAG: SPOR domain-containing protein [Pseudomonadota bacterium]